MRRAPQRETSSSMGDWIAQGNVAEVKVVLTSVAFALAA